MSDIVVDSCVAAKWFVSEPDSPQAEKLIVDAAATGDRLIMLDLARTEITNVIWKYFRQGRFTADEARAAMADLSVAQVHVEPSTRLLSATLEIGMQYDRAIYDALFVAIAVDLGVPGVTSDEPLVNVVGTAYPQIKLLRNWP